MHAAGGVEWREAQALAEGVHDDYRVTDTWEDAIERWLETPDLDGTLPGADGFSTHDVLTQALCFREHAVKRADETRAAKVLRALGFCQKVQKEDGKSVRRWVRG
jgi:predicted P-loop ATPase